MSFKFSFSLLTSDKGKDIDFSDIYLARRVTVYETVIIWLIGTFPIITWIASLDSPNSEDCGADPWTCSVSGISSR